MAVKLRPTLTSGGEVAYFLTGPASALHDRPERRTVLCDGCGGDPYKGGLAFMVATFQDEAAAWWCLECVRDILT